MNAVIHVEGLHKSYGGTPAVSDVSFGVREGEIFGILGSNGAGKTTTVECLQGLRSFDAGDLRVLGRLPGDAELRRLVGSQLQDAALPERLRVQEALDLFAGADAVDRGELMAAWGLSEHRRKAFGDLSGGLKQRLFIALALLNRPEVVFFDEITQGLDPVARREVWDVIRAVRDQGSTVVLVTHFMEEAEALCDRLAVFEAGTIVAAGTPTEIIAAHGNASSIAFTPDGHDDDTFAGCPGVRSIERDGSRMVVRGDAAMAAHACAALVAHGPPPPDLRIHQASLEDAVVALEASKGATR